jgi:hypothetical protein
MVRLREGWSYIGTSTNLSLYNGGYNYDLMAIVTSGEVDRVFSGHHFDTWDGRAVYRVVRDERDREREYHTAGREKPVRHRPVDLTNGLPSSRPRR